MSSNTKIVVLHSKELIYATALIIISILIIIVALSLFAPGTTQTSNNTNTTEISTENASENTSDEIMTDTASVNTLPATSASAVYMPGLYSSMVQLGNSNIELQIAVDYNHINSITLMNLDEAVSAMYPLVEPTLEELSTAIITNQSLDNIEYTSEQRYTSLLLMQAISTTLDKAKITDLSETKDVSAIY